MFCCLFIFLELIRNKSKDSLIPLQTLVTLALMTVPPYPVSTRGLVQLVGLSSIVWPWNQSLLSTTTAQRQMTWQPDWWITIPQLVTDKSPELKCSGYWLFLLRVWCVNRAGEQLSVGGENGKEMHNLNGGAVFKINSLCLCFGFSTPRILMFYF